MWYTFDITQVRGVYGTCSGHLLDHDQLCMTITEVFKKVVAVACELSVQAMGLFEEFEVCLHPRMESFRDLHGRLSSALVS